MATQFERNQSLIDTMFNAAMRVVPQHRSREMLNLKREPGCYRSRPIRNWGTARPATVVNGKVVHV